MPAAPHTSAMGTCIHPDGFWCGTRALRTRDVVPPRHSCCGSAPWYPCAANSDIQKAALKIKGRFPRPRRILLTRHLGTHRQPAQTMKCSAHQSAKIQKAISTSPHNVPALVAILSVLQQSYFLHCVSKICWFFFLTAWVGNWANLVYMMAPPSSYTDSAELEANSSGIIVNLMVASTACFPST